MFPGRDEIGHGWNRHDFAPGIPASPVYHPTPPLYFNFVDGPTPSLKATFVSVKNGSHIGSHVWVPSGWYQGVQPWKESSASGRPEAVRAS
jgi:hypothetical protein